ncbi:hypothetical protein D9619_002502 [Psilocybe cf. subviscida]|uniref:Protein PBN1 n=1 Tax=Psilocybe cf. subviscida TaxID=2480587 RepID=A0A8H5ETS6_9AGAR|nr:hypothetical protein D9619_002502 [Psilocybe cf. subviscida]
MLPFLLAELSLAASALANTEIVNFKPSKAAPVNIPFTSSWPTLSPSKPFIALNVTSAPLGAVLPEELCPSLRSWGVERPHADLCRHELYAVLDLDASEWDEFEKFTLRLSWPAFHPTDFKMTILDPTALSSFAPSSSVSSTKGAPTRLKYARIQFTHTGVPTYPSDEPEISPASRARRTVPVHILLEPLYFNVLPKSTFPVAIAIGVVLLLCLPVAWGMHSLLKQIADQAVRKEAKRMEAKVKKAE